MAVSEDHLQTTLPLPPFLNRVSELVDVRPEAFILGDEETREAALQAAKYAFDLCEYRLVLALLSLEGLKVYHILKLTNNFLLISRAARTARSCSCSSAPSVC